MWNFGPPAQNVARSFDHTAAFHFASKPEIYRPARRKRGNRMPLPTRTNCLDPLTVFDSENADRDKDNRQNSVKANLKTAPIRSSLCSQSFRKRQIQYCSHKNGRKGTYILFVTSSIISATCKRDLKNSKSDGGLGSRLPITLLAIQNVNAVYNDTIRIEDCEVIICCAVHIRGSGFGCLPRTSPWHLLYR
ncbi:hypothetical protein BC827DRAFT_1247934 [Russula dissimulans]|nr:hypothetical protein BC827DRAFT_1247934 [Russula dissimulans]